LLALFDAFSQLKLTHLVNNIGTCEIVFDGDDARYNLFELNGIVEVLRKLPGHEPLAVPAALRRGNGWYAEWSGLHTDLEQNVYQNGRQQFTSRCVSGLDLVQRREVLWKATEGASESKKLSTPAQTAMHEFVEQNCGAGALVSAGRLVDGAITGFHVAATQGLGVNWSGSRAYTNVLEVVQDIGDYAGIDFDVTHAGNGEWLFESYADQLGEDRTTNGLGPDGKNAAGNAPVIFAVELGNVEQVTRTVLNGGTANVVAALGKDQYEDREVAVRSRSADIDARRLNQREVSRNCNTQDDDGSLETSAYEWLASKQAADDFSFTPLVAASTLYGVHYWWGDRVTARAFGTEQDKRLVGVTINVGEKGESMQSWEFATIPRTR